MQGHAGIQPNPDTRRLAFDSAAFDHQVEWEWGPDDFQCQEWTPVRAPDQPLLDCGADAEIQACATHPGAIDQQDRRRQAEIDRGLRASLRQHQAPADIEWNARKLDSHWQIECGGGLDGRADSDTEPRSSHHSTDAEPDAGRGSAIGTWSRI